MKAVLASVLMLGSTFAVAIAAGCGQATAPVMTAAAQAPAAAGFDGTITLDVNTHLTDARRLQAIIAAYGASDIDHLDLTLTNLTTSATANKTVSNADVVANTTQTFAHLRMNTPYRVSAKAYLTTGSGTQISVDDASSASVTTSNNDAISPSVSVPVQLIPHVFDGTATGSFTVNGGGVTDAATPAAIL